MCKINSYRTRSSYGRMPEGDGGGNLFLFYKFDAILISKAADNPKFTALILSTI